VTLARTRRRRPRKTYHHGNLPPALVAVAKTLIIERGLDGFTLREVARRVGVTHVAAYRHYADRRALLAAVSESGFRQLHGRLERARRRASPSGAPRLRAVLAAYLPFCWDERALAALMFGPRLSHGGEFPELEAAVFATLGPIEDTIASLAPEASRRGLSARDLALALWTFVHGFSTLAYDKAAYPTAARAARAFDDMLTPMLAGMFGAGSRAGGKRTARR
jgi:AcrR family transcriptional regulator